MKKAVVLLLAVVMLISVLAACGGTNDTENTDPSGTGANNPGSTEPGETNPADPSTFTKGGDMVVAVGTSLEDFFLPYRGTWPGGVAYPALEQLGFRDENFEWQLVIAETFDVDEENYKVTIKLREGIHFHEGQELTADDLVWLLNMYLENGQGAKIGNPTSIEKVDKYTFTVQYDSFSLLYRSWLLSVYVYCKETYEQIGAEGMYSTINGTGPYVLKENKTDVSLYYVRNENYWRDHDWGPDTITILRLSDSTTRMAAFLNGEIDTVEVNSDMAMMERLQNEGYVGVPAEVSQQAQIWAIPVTLNAGDPLSNVKVREAIYMYGVDWDGIAYAMVGSNATHVDQIGYSKYIFEHGYTSVSEVNYEKAKQMIADAGYPNGFSTTLYVNSTWSNAAVCLQAELKKLGIESEIEIVKPADLFKDKSIDTGIVVHGNITNGTTSDRLQKYNSEGVTYGTLTNWSNYNYAEMLAAGLAARTEEEQDEYFYEYCVTMVQKDFIFWPMYVQTGYTFYQPWYHYEGPLSPFNIMNVYVDKH